MLLGVIAPVILLLIPKVRNNQSGLFISSVMVVSGFIMNRINVSITGMDRSSGTNYFPSWTELAVTASIVVAGFVLFGLAVKYLNIFSPEEMKEAVAGRRAELPVPALLQQPLRSATTLSFALGAVFMLCAGALAFDGVRLRVPARPLELSDQMNGMDLSRGFAQFNPPDKIAIKMGRASPGQVVFNHARHLDAHHPSCVTCHSGQFMMLKTSADITPDKKMTNCGSCHDGIRAVSVRDEKRCDTCHTAKPQT
jgi:c(7)-type cytochrome triheme protein